MKVLRLYKFLIGLGVFTLVIGGICKIMHWPFGDFFITMAYIIILLIYPRLVLLNKERTIYDIIKVVGIFLWGGFGLAFYFFYPEHKLVLAAISKLGIVTWIGAALFSYLSTSKQLNSQINAIVKIGYIVGFSGLAVGVFFKTMHWPGAKVLLVFSAIIAGLTFFYTTFVSSDE